MTDNGTCYTEKPKKQLPKFKTFFRAYWIQLFVGIIMLAAGSYYGNKYPEQGETPLFSNPWYWIVVSSFIIGGIIWYIYFYKPRKPTWKDIDDMNNPPMEG